MRSNAQINSLNKMTLILRHGQCRPSKAKNVALTLLSCWVYSESTAQSQTCAPLPTQMACREWGRERAEVSSAARGSALVY